MVLHVLIILVVMVILWLQSFIYFYLSLDSCRTWKRGTDSYKDQNVYQAASMKLNTVHDPAKELLAVSSRKSIRSSNYFFILNYLLLSASPRAKSFIYDFIASQSVVSLFNYF